MPTNLDKTTLQALWVNGFIPQGTDFANLINSQVNIAETSAQTMLGSLTTTEIVTPRVSATNGNFTGTVNIAGSASIQGTLTVSDVFTLNASAQINSNLNVTGGISTFGVVSAGGIATTVLSENISIVSAAGTAQATAGAISASVGISRLQGTADGQQTGYRLPSPAFILGLIQTLVHEGAVSGNLWPSVGCKINALGTNAAFALAASTPYMVTYTQVSGYAVK